MKSFEQQSKIDYYREIDLRSLGIQDPDNPSDEQKLLIQKWDELSQLSVTELAALIKPINGLKERQEVISEARADRLRREEEIWRLDYQFVQADEKLKQHWPSEEIFLQEQANILKELYQSSYDHYVDKNLFHRRFPNLEAWRAFYMANLSQFVVMRIEQHVVLGNEPDVYAAAKRAAEIEPEGFYGYTAEETIGPVIGGHGETKYISELSEADDTLLVHSMALSSFKKACIGGKMGMYGKGQISFSKNGVVTDNQIAVVFRMKDLFKAYDLFKIQEDYRDADILDEVRSCFAVDMRLAVAAIPIDHEHFSDLGVNPNSGLGTARFGEKEIAALRTTVLKNMEE